MSPYIKHENNYRSDYINIIKRIIKNMNCQYTCHVYIKEYISTIRNEDLTINDQLFLDRLLMKIRRKSISYATCSYKKKKTKNKMKEK